MLNAKQFAWMYLVLNGEANKNPSFYGGYKAVDSTAKYKIVNYCKDYRESFLAKIRAFGVDWDKTLAPETEDFSVFEGTFHDASSKEMLIGTLVLKNGEKQVWCANIPTIGVFEMMENIEYFKSEYYQIFGA